MTILRAGQRLGGYTVEDLLGTGGMGEVYRATHQTLERTVAIKVINPAFNSDPTFPLRFLREAKVVARLSHPHIVTVYDFGEQGELAYLVMEIAEGGTFRDRAAQLKTLAEAVEELAPIADALGYAHSKGVVHRDLKPINLLLTEQQRLLLADFGLARIASESLDVELSDVGKIMGTPQYMAPEQVLGQDVDHRADIYALGILTFEVLTGHLPYTGPTVAVMQQHLKAPPPSLRESMPDAPPVLDAAILRATAKQPSERFNSTGEFLAQLREAARIAPSLPVGLARAAGPGGTEPTASVPQLGAPIASPDPADQNTLMLPGTGIPAAEGVPAEANAFDQDHLASGAAEWARPAAWSGTSAASRVTSDEISGELHPWSRLRQRTTAFNQAQWLTIATVLLVVVFINAIGLWLTRAGLAANRGNVLEGVNSYIFHHLGWFKSALTGIAFVLAALAVFAMRAAIIDNHHISPQLYRRLRQYHRLVGYAAIAVAFAVGLLTCIGIFGFGTSSPRVVLHSILGTALLVTILAKLAVVRYYPAQRRYLKLLGQGLLILFFLVFATSTVPFVWSHITGSSKSNPYNPYIGRSVPGPRGCVACAPQAPDDAPAP